jgi:hypothetical protein
MTASGLALNVTVVLDLRANVPLLADSEGRP